MMTLENLDFALRQSRVPEPFVYFYTEPERVQCSGVITGRITEVGAWGLCCVFENVLILPWAKDRALVKKEMPYLAIASHPYRTTVVAVEDAHPLHDMLIRWVEDIGGTKYARDDNAEWYYLHKEG